MTPEEVGGITYYNEMDDFAADWLERLIAAGQLPPGWVDRRDIRQVTPADLEGYPQCHFFAGIGGWPLALQQAGWGARPVWTGSCPCQPYSAAGKQHGHLDPRDLWPQWMALIRECRPPVLLGEQVEGAIRHGWLDRLSADLEGEGYAVGATVFGAHSVGAPHQRQRLWWVACGGPSSHRGRGVALPGGQRQPVLGLHLPGGEASGADPEVGRGGQTGGVVHPPCDGLGGRAAGRPGECPPPVHAGEAELGRRGHIGGLGDPECQRTLGGDENQTGSADADRRPVGVVPPAVRPGGQLGGLGDPHGPGPQGRRERRDRAHQCAPREGSLAGQAGGDLGGVLAAAATPGVRGGVAHPDGGEPSHLGVQRGGGHGLLPADQVVGGGGTCWDPCAWLPCRDGKWRPVEPGTFPLAHGVPARVGRLRGYGNAIVVPAGRVWAEVILATLLEGDAAGAPADAPADEAEVLAL